MKICYIVLSMLTRIICTLELFLSSCLGLGVGPVLYGIKSRVIVPKFLHTVSLQEEGTYVFVMTLLKNYNYHNPQ